MHPEWPSFLLGFGNEVAMAGAYVKLTIAMGTSRGSFLGFELGGPLSNPLRPVIDCKGVTLKIDLGTGVAVLIDKNFLSVLPSLKGRRTRNSLRRQPQSSRRV